MRLQPRSDQLVKAVLGRLNFTRPIVGIHVRRSDKLFHEAEYHAVDEYMAAVEDIYETLEITNGGGARKIYVATDDVSVFDEINKKYPDYTVIGDRNISSRASGKTKYSKEALDGILVDIHLLSMCDFVVCTFSSNICRLVYEMMQSLHVDASTRVTSLDWDYGFTGMQKLRLYRVILQHSARSAEEMNMRRGDIIAVNFYNATNNYGYNLNTSESGYFPIFKTVEDAKSVPFPTYTYV
ncbi:alpha-(1,6)-fucosyltransferase-like [Schistocerca americana]|uniref:alpha-(1,6)-fucosyltransferase-like n=1 Tax=Schistocerca americana TaxID=7009 RepID=UPI001F500698|nr:alpha-(1,6)-fucosyltransferase-like [Schistocerca americana]